VRVQEYTFISLSYKYGGHDNSVGIATRYGLDGPAIEFRRWRDVPWPFKTAPRSTKPPVQRVQIVFPEGKEARAWD
jgi:hypothetical protein